MAFSQHFRGFERCWYQICCGPTPIQKQVAQLWQRDRAKLDTFAINVHRYSQTRARNCIFGPPYEDIRGNISTFSERYTKKRCSRVSSRECQFTRKTANSRFWAPRLFFFGGGVLGGNICDSSLARCKAHSRLSTGYKWTFFASSHGWGSNMSQLVFVEGRCSLWG